jgi:hypothetical protein
MQGLALNEVSRGVSIVRSLLRAGQTPHSTFHHALQLLALEEYLGASFIESELVENSTSSICLLRLLDIAGSSSIITCSNDSLRSFCLLKLKPPIFHACLANIVHLRTVGGPCLQRTCCRCH